MIPVSVIIITFNEEKNIGRCIDSVKAVADEIIVLDSFSTDDTVSIALQKGAIVKQASFKGFIEQKNLAIRLATYDYILSLDADETLDETLTASILQAKSGIRFKAYSMNRCAVFLDKSIRHGLWYPDKKIRLFDKKAASWGGINPHDKIVLHEPLPVMHLKGDILHYSYSSVDDFVNQNNRFSTISSQALYHSGKRSNLFKILLNPFWAFINGYILRLGFLDGLTGFIIAVNTAHYTFSKHVKLLMLAKNKTSQAVSGQSLIISSRAKSTKTYLKKTVAR